MAECRIELHAAEPCALAVRLIAGMPWTSPAMTRADASAWPAGLRLVFAGTALVKGSPMQASHATTPDASGCANEGTNSCASR